MRPGSAAIRAAWLLAGLVSTAAAAADTRLALWLTDPVGAGDGRRCRQPAAGQGLPARPPTLTEQDVAAWDPATGRWTLSPEFAGSEAGRTLRDRCFVLALDGRVVSRGIALSSHSARLIGFATLGVLEQGGRLALRLSAGNRDGQARLIHVDALDAVLGRRGTPERP